MTPFVMTYVDTETLELFQDIRRLVMALPDIALGLGPSGEPILVSCHMVCRALSALYPETELRDGQFMNVWDHSWLTFRDFIIDPYPVALLGGPVLLHVGGLTPWSKLYRPGDVPALRYPHLVEACTKVVMAVRETHLQLVRR